MSQLETCESILFERFESKFIPLQLVAKLYLYKYFTRFSSFDGGIFVPCPNLKIINLILIPSPLNFH